MAAQESAATRGGGSEGYISEPKLFSSAASGRFESSVWEWQPSNEGRVFMDGKRSQYTRNSYGCWEMGVTGPRRKEAPEQANVVVLPFG